jgi:hypothetical protein
VLRIERRVRYDGVDDGVAGYASTKEQAVESPTGDLRRGVGQADRSLWLDGQPVVLAVEIDVVDPRLRPVVVGRHGEEVRSVAQFADVG